MGGNDVDMAWAGVSDIVSFVPTGKVKVLGIPDGSAIPGPNRRAHATLSRAFRLGALWKRHMSVAKRMLNSCPGRPLRARFADLLLAITTIVVTYLGAEAAFSFAGLRYVPLRLHQDLPEDIRVFAQSSKAALCLMILCCFSAIRKRKDLEIGSSKRIPTTTALSIPATPSTR